MNFKEVDERFKHLKARYQAGELSEAEFKAQLQDLMVQDEQGAWWMIGYETEMWYRNNGTDWVQAEPPGIPSRQEKVVTPVEKVQEPAMPKSAAPAAAKKGIPRLWLGIGGAGIVALLVLCALAIKFYPGGLIVVNTPDNPTPADTEVPIDKVATDLAAASAATATGTTTATKPPVVATEAPSADSSILFQDDFSDPNSGWSAFQNSKQFAGYSGDGQFVIRAITPNQDVWSHPGEDFSDVSVEVDATKIGGPDVNDLGLICRYQDDSNFYYFMISSDGRQAIGKFQDSNYEILSPGDFELTEGVIKGNATNHLRAVCQGSKLTFYVNGQEVSTATDTTFTNGDVGLIAGAFDEPNVEIFFDNFVARRP